MFEVYLLRLSLKKWGAWRRLLFDTTVQKQAFFPEENKKKHACWKTSVSTKPEFTYTYDIIMYVSRVCIRKAFVGSGIRVFSMWYDRMTYGAEICFAHDFISKYMGGMDNIVLMFVADLFI